MARRFGFAWRGFLGLETDDLRGGNTVTNKLLDTAHLESVPMLN